MTSTMDMGLLTLVVVTVHLPRSEQAHVGSSCDWFQLRRHTSAKGATLQKPLDSADECLQICLQDDSCRAVDVIATLCYLHRERVTDAMLVVQHGASHYRRMPRPCGQAAKKKALPLGEKSTILQLLKRNVDARDRQNTGAQEHRVRRKRDGLTGSMFADFGLAVAVSVLLCGFSYFGQAVCNALLSGKYEACMECTLMTSIVPHRTTLADLALPVTYIVTAFLVSTVQGSCDTFKLMPHVYGRGATVQKVANSSAECEDVCLLDDSCRSVDVIATLCYLHRERVTDAMLVVQHGASHYRRMPRPCGQAAKKKALRKAFSFALLSRVGHDS
ncbi:hypothetical protein LSAT2_031576 [Lamellibrachia satsuma]|nr:hypothetical protein LSAT2_031576 [Lamellibrachia satsuma]